jgi:hypothetical protein
MRRNLCTLVVSACLFATGCRNPLVPEEASVTVSGRRLVLSADIMWQGSDPVARLHARNPGQEPVTVARSACSVEVRLYSAGGRPVGWQPASLHSCPDIYLTVTIPPADTVVLWSRSLREAPPGRLQVILAGSTPVDFELLAGVLPHR